MKHVDAILLSDLHIMDKQPKCRTDNFIDTQIKKLEWLRKVWIKHNQPTIIIAGDVFDKWNASNECLQIASYLPSKCMSIYGNHDLKSHNPNLLNKTAYGALDSFRRIDLDKYDPSSDIYGFPYGCDFDEAKEIKKQRLRGRLIAVCHHFVYKGKKPFPGALMSAEALLNKLKQFDLVVVGDNHRPFTYRNKRGQLLVNPGAFTRHTADLIDHEPRVYLYNEKRHDVEALYVPIDKSIMTREYIKQENERNEKLELFADKLDDDIDLAIDYESNLKTYIKENSIDQEIENELMEALNE